MNVRKYSSEQSQQSILNMYVEMGNDAMKGGNEAESLKWYSEGLSIAKTLNNLESQRLFSNLIITLI